MAERRIVIMSRLRNRNVITLAKDRKVVLPPSYRDPDSALWLDGRSGWLSETDATEVRKLMSALFKKGHLYAIPAGDDDEPGVTEDMKTTKPAAKRRRAAKAED